MSVSVESTIPSKLIDFKENLYHLAELLLQQTLILCDAIEEANRDKLLNVIQGRQCLYQIKEKNDLIIESVVLEAASLQEENKGRASELGDKYEKEPLYFVLTGIRITVYFEQIQESIDSIARSYIDCGDSVIGKVSESVVLHCVVTRMATMVGIAVEALVEEKDDIFGSVQEVYEELCHFCFRLSQSFAEEKELELGNLEPLFLFVTKIQSMGSLMAKVARELFQLFHFYQK